MHACMFQASLKSEFEALNQIQKGGKPTEHKHSDQFFHLHLKHCFEYLRQAVMCAGDTALEKAMIVDGRIIRGVDGWGVEHECRDYTAIFDFAAQHHSDSRTGIA